MARDSALRRHCLRSTRQPSHTDPTGEQLVLVGGSETADFKTPTGSVWTCSSTALDAAWIQQPAVPWKLVGSQLVYEAGLDEMVLVGGVDAMGVYSSESFVTTKAQTVTPLGPATPPAWAVPRAT